MAQLVFDQHNPAPYKPGGVASIQLQSQHWGSRKQEDCKFKRSLKKHTKQKTPKPSKPEGSVGSCL